MKKLLIALPALLALISLHTVFSQWQTYQTPVNVNFVDVSVVSSDIIWAAGQNTVVKSTNGGNSWTVTTGIFISAQHISAIDENTAWVTSGSRIFRTTNGGINWIEQFYNDPDFINEIHFFNANTGIFLRDPVNPPDTAGFFITRNGGANWYRSSHSPVTTILNDGHMGAIDTNLVWFGDNDKLYKLTGGLDNPFQLYSIGHYTYMSYFANVNTAFASDAINLFKSTNGGVNWVQTMANFNSGAIMFTAASNIVVAGNQGFLRISFDLGNTWQPTVAPGYSTNYSDAYDTNSIWVAAAGGKLLRYNIGYIGINPISTEVPAAFKLYQNYPNPFNPQTNIRFDMAKGGDISFKVYDVLGKIVYTINEYKPAGIYEIKFDGSAYASGVYYYIIEAEGFTETKKMLIIK